MPIYKDYNNHEINDILDDTWEIGWFKSNKSFQSIFKKWGLTEEELILKMSDQFDAKSFKKWEQSISDLQNTCNDVMIVQCCVHR